jgi:hypothetical protein
MPLGNPLGHGGADGSTERREGMLTLVYSVHGKERNDVLLLG